MSIILATAIVATRISASEQSTAPVPTATSTPTVGISWPVYTPPSATPTPATLQEMVMQSNAVAEVTVEDLPSGAIVLQINK